ncbi:MAG: hypothetical protein ABJA79_03775 [Parafilimonas sp.]
MAEREKVIASKEGEFLELKKQVEIFPATLGKSVDNACKQMEEQLTARHHFEKNYTAKRWKARLNY